MPTRILALVLVLSVNIPLARGQSVGKGDLPPGSPSTVKPDAAASPETEETWPNWLRLPWLGHKDADRPLAASAEEAEFLAPKPSRFWARSEYLIWRIKSANLPPIVTTGDFNDPAPGALSSLGTTVLLGGSGLDYFDRQGGRFSAGYWLDDDHQCGLEAGYFFLAARSNRQSFVSPGSPVLANPFFNVNTGTQDASLVTYPGILSGQIAVDAPSFLQGADANFTNAFWRGEHFRVEGLAGFRWVNLSEGLRIEDTSLISLAPQYVGLVPFDGNTISVSDSFSTQNHFYGGQLGLRTEWQRKRWTIGLLAKVALGVSNETVTIRGSTTIDASPPIAQNGGLYAVGSNSGQFTRNAFAVVPEAGLNLGFQLTDHVRIFAGYTFLYWSNVARPGDQVDTSVNLNQVPTSTTFGAAGGPARPAFSFRTTDFFAHGVNLGIEIRY